MLDVRYSVLLSRHMIYFNQAATSYPKPQRMLSAVAEYLRQEPCRADRGIAPDAGESVLGAARREIAAMFGVMDFRHLIFTSGATESLNLALRGLHYRGRNIVTTVTEHNSVLRPLKRLEKEQGLRIVYVPCDVHGRVAPENILCAIDDDTALVVMNHGSNVTGIVQDIAPVRKETQCRGIPFLLDVSQTAGHIPVTADLAPMIAFTAHKGLLGMAGTGGLVLAPELELDPLKTGGTGIYSDLPEQPMDRPLHYEAGTPNMPGIIALQAGIREIQTCGLDWITAREKELTMRLLSGLREISGITVYGHPGAMVGLPVVSLRIAGQPVEETGYLLSEMYGIVSRAGLHCAPLIHKYLGTWPEGTLRLSPSYVNTETEIDTCLDALREIEARCKS